MSRRGDHEYKHPDGYPPDSDDQRHWKDSSQRYNDNNRFSRNDYDNGDDINGDNRRSGYDDDYRRRDGNSNNRRGGYDDGKEGGNYGNQRSNRYGDEPSNHGREERGSFNEGDRPIGRGITKSYRPAYEGDNRHETNYDRNDEGRDYKKYDEGCRDGYDDDLQGNNNRYNTGDRGRFRDNDEEVERGNYGDYKRGDGERGGRVRRGRGRIIRGSSGDEEGGQRFGGFEGKDSRTCFRCGGPHLARECTEGDNRKKPVTYIPEEPTNDEDQMFSTIGKGINFNKYEDIPVDVVGDRPPQPISSFDECDIEDQLKRNVRKAKYDRPTPIQKWAIPIILGDRDLMGCAQTGSGKTAGFLLPVLTGMLRKGEVGDHSRGPAPVALIIGPTRELVMQIYEEARKFSTGLPVKSVVVYGGVSVAHHINKLGQGADIVIATVGRLLDFVRRGIISLSRVRYLILDEADRMLDMGFKDDILKLCFDFDMPQKEERQTLLFSATFPEEIRSVASSVLKNYLFVAVGRVGGANQDIEQVLELVPLDKKKERLMQILQSQSESLKTIVFVEKKVMSDFLAVILCQNGLRSTSIHGDREQREREEALRTLKSGKTPIIVATSVAARGLDIPGIGHVINYDLPKSIDEYVHRIGRTGRCGNVGMATSFYDPNCDSGLAQDLQNILAEVHQEVPRWLQDGSCYSDMSDVRYEGERLRGHRGDQGDQYGYHGDEGEESW